MTNASKTLILIMLLAFGFGCGYSKPKSATPMIATLNPAAMTAGSGQFQLEVDGSNFVNGAWVNFNGVTETTTFVSSSKVTATIPAAAIMNSGSVPVTVTNPASSNGTYGMSSAATSGAASFTIN